MVIRASYRSVTAQQPAAGPVLNRRAPPSRFGERERRGSTLFPARIDAHPQRVRREERLPGVMPDLAQTTAHA